jgi:hypothetical protein
MIGKRIPHTQSKLFGPSGLYIGRHGTQLEMKPVISVTEGGPSRVRVGGQFASSPSRATTRVGGCGVY